MEIWVLILTFVLHVVEMDVIAQSHQWLFTTEATCQTARPSVEAHVAKLAPTGYVQPLTARLTTCLRQRTVSGTEIREYLGTLPAPQGKEGRQRVHKETP